MLNMLLENQLQKVKFIKFLNKITLELYSDLPMMHLIPVENREIPKEGIYNCPLYKVVSR